MSWEPSDRWRDDYDQWKLASPYDDEPEDECDHSDYEADILTGRASCNICGHSWYQTKEEIEAEHRRQIEYAEWEAEQHRRLRWFYLTWPFLCAWFRLTYPFRWAWYHMMNRLWPRKSLKFLRDDEIPF